MNAYFVIISLIGAAMCLGLGLLILSRNPRHSSNIGFTLGIFNLIVITVGNALIMFPSGGRALTSPGTSSRSSGSHSCLRPGLTFAR